MIARDNFYGFCGVLKLVTWSRKNLNSTKAFLPSHYAHCWLRFETAEKKFQIELRIIRWSAYCVNGRICSWPCVLGSWFSIRKKTANNKTTCNRAKLFMFQVPFKVFGVSRVRFWKIHEIFKDWKNCLQKWNILKINPYTLCTKRYISHIAKQLIDQIAGLIFIWKNF